MKIKKEISSHKTIYYLLFIILLISAFLRLYKLDEFLGFWYDQGRDALVIWRFLHEGKFFLIGPVTGIEGIFLGPFYYWFLTPFYFLGGGSPVFVTAFLAWLSVLGIFLLYLVGKECFSREVGLLAAALYGFSYSLVTFSRWLANPNPLPLFSLLVVFGLLKIYRGKEKFWLWTALFTGLALQFEAAAAIFFLPAILVFVIWQRKKIKNRRMVLGAILIFFATLLPQIIFNLRHQGILLAAFEKFLARERSFQMSFWEVAKLRLNTYFEVFFSKLFYAKKNVSFIFLIIFFVSALWRRKDFLKPEVKILLLCFFSPLFLLLFYQGNYGYIWDYYFSGVWPIFILLVAFLLFSLWKKFWGKPFVLAFLVCFLFINLDQLRIYYKTGIGINLKSQLSAISWIYQDAQGKEFNVDVYVPPVIPHAYDYLFKWYGGGKYGREPVAERLRLLYILYEVDSPHPERLEVWLARQKEIGEVISQSKFGGITVQRRERLQFNE